MKGESQRFRVRAFGPLACFTRPEMKVERVSYEVITPSAARGLLEAVLWKPAIRWRIHRVEVHQEIRFTSVKRNEVNGGKASPGAAQLAGTARMLPYFADEDRAQRSTLALANVDYIIEASFRMTDRAGPADNVKKFEEMFARRIERGQVHHQPYFGCREFVAYVEDAPTGARPIALTKPLGFMLHDLEFDENGRGKPRFFSAMLRDGVVEVPPFESAEHTPKLGGDQ
jgi:CRISPR-associated protein Cas5d